MAQITFAASPTGKAEAATQSKFNSSTPTLMAMVRGDTLTGLTNATTRTLLELPGADGIRIMIRRETGNIIVLSRRISQGFTTNIITFASSGFAASDMIVLGVRYAFAASGSDFFAWAYKSDGTALATGDVRLGGANISYSTSTVVLWNQAQAATIGGAAILSAPPASLFANPVSDPNLVALYYMDDDGTGKLKDSVSGGTALTVTDGTLTSDADSWDPAGSASNAPRSQFYHLQGMR